MKYVPRIIEKFILKALERNKSVLLLGPRQTGKTTLLGRLECDFNVSFVRPDVRQRYEKNPSLLIGEVEGLKIKGKKRRAAVFLDEVQKIPEIFDVVQDLIDRKVANFILTGSSARKLYRGSKVNFLPGRVVSLRLDPFILEEIPEYEIKSWLFYGSLPGIFLIKKASDKETDLASYVTTYLEEEVRAESIVRNLGSFARFLEYAAAESGQIVNFRKLSQEIGVAHTTIASYYQILEDCLIVERFEPLTRSRTRKKLTKSQKYLFFDLGVRRLAAGEGIRLPKDVMGRLFEQFVGLQLLRLARLSEKKTHIRFWRDPDGPEVDWVIEKGDQYIPIEVKWTQNPSVKDIKHLKVFLSEYKNAESAYLICQIPRRIKLDKSIIALPWQEIQETLGS